MDSDLRYLFETNVVPTKQETTHIRLLLDKDFEEIQPLNKQINQLQDTLYSLICDRKQRRARIRAKKAVLSAIRRIPPEIIGQIFLRYMHIDDEYKDRPDLPPVPWRGPLVLSRICSGWRQVALTLPQLWSQISINFDQIRRSRLRRTSRTQTNPMANLARFWIRCASNLPLTVSFECSDAAGFDSEIAHIVMNSANRFKDIKMECPEHLILGCLSLMTSSFGDLEAVDLRGVYEIERNQPSQHWLTKYPPIFKLSPKLRKLSICGITPLVFSAIPVGQITELSLQFDTVGRRAPGFTPSKCHAILRHSPNLVVFCVTIGDEPSNVTNVPTPAVVLQHLRKLDVRSPPTRPSSLDFFYRPLVLPALKDLRIKSQGIHSLAALISRSSCNLERLECSPRQSPEEVLSLVPSLIELHIDMQFFTERISQGISQYELLPKLEVLGILPFVAGIAPPTHIFKAIFELVKSRWWPGAIARKSFNGIIVPRLKRLEFFYGMYEICALDPSQLLKFLEQCKREGLEIENCPFPDVVQKVDGDGDEDEDSNDEDDDEDDDYYDDEDEDEDE